MFCCKVWFSILWSGRVLWVKGHCCTHEYILFLAAVIDLLHFAAALTSLQASIPGLRGSTEENICPSPEFSLATWKRDSNPDSNKMHTQWSEFWTTVFPALFPCWLYCIIFYRGKNPRLSIFIFLSFAFIFIYVSKQIGKWIQRLIWCGVRPRPGLWRGLYCVESQLYLFVAVWPWVNYCTSLCLRIFIYKMEIIKWRSSWWF